MFKSDKDQIIINPIPYVNGVVKLHGSKSISNRALLLASQAVGTTRLINFTNSDDTRYMLGALNKLGIKYCLYNNHNICEVYGIGRSIYSNKKLTLFLGNAGFVMRSLTAALCLEKQHIVLTGEERMKNRPIGNLINALRQGGAKINYLEKINYPPLLINGGYKGGKIIVDGEISSQFLSSLLMIAPMASEESYIYVRGTLVSKPYINITISLMKKFGIDVYNDNYKLFYVNNKNKYFSPGEYEIEGDASNASYFLASAAIKGGTIRVVNVGSKSIQGDIRFADILKSMGAKIKFGDNYVECTRNELHSINLNAIDIPDIAMTVAIIALFTKKETGTTIIRNIDSWRFKESNRISSMIKELSKTGAVVNYYNNSLFVKAPNKINDNICISTYNDHRIAMCFSLLALSSNTTVTILNYKCVKKTFPNFFKQFFSLITNYL